ncbi:AI-2E family transporter [Aquihabitans sp. McL0605]|uniref:AI-2E family transporter n=1 Tax=Aquihabitans sp. McL0605 TaxID=3415671 RepID=UPI003CF94ED5
MTDPGSDATPSAREIGIEEGRILAVVDWHSYLHLALGLLLLLVVTGFARSTVDSLTKIVIAGVLALALDRPVRMLQGRGMSRGASAAVVTLALIGALVLVAVLLVPPAVRQAAAFSDDLPSTLEQFYDFPVVGNRIAQADIAAKSDRWLEELPGTVTTDSVSDIMTRLVLGIASVLQVLLLTLAFILDGETLVARTRSLVPDHLISRVDRGGALVYDILGRYFAGSLLVAVMNGTYILAVGLVIGVPLIVLAAIWVMITNLIPQIGGFLGGSVFVVLALTQGAATGAIAAVAFMAYMSAENYFIQPAIVGKAVNLSPPTTMIAAIVGGTAAGVPGALIATPLVGSVKAILLAVRQRDSELIEATDRDHDGDGDDHDGGSHASPP